MIPNYWKLKKLSLVNKDYFRTGFLFLLMQLNLISFGQNIWFKHIDGWQARTSLIKGDTILTCGQDYTTLSGKDKYGVFLTWLNMKGDILGHFKINLDSLEKDDSQSTTISYNYNSSVDCENEWKHLIGLNYGKKKQRAFVLTFDTFLSNKFSLEEYTIDTFSTYINNIIPFQNHKIEFVPYAVIQNPQEVILNTVIYKVTNGNRIKIHEIINTASLKYETRNHLRDNISNNTFFFIKKQMTDYAGSPRLWNDYIVKMDTLGKEQWSTLVNNRDSINTEGMQMVQMTNGHLLISWCDRWYRKGKNPQGHPSEPQVNKKCTLWFAEIDRTGKVLWRSNIKSFLTFKIGRDSSHNLIHSKAIITHNGVLWTGINSWGYDRCYLLKTNFNGNPIWYREYDLHKNEEEFIPYDIAPSQDGGFVLTGEYINSNQIQYATLVKVDSFGCLEPNCEIFDASANLLKVEPNIDIYPNPLKDFLSIKGKDIQNVTILSSSGQIVIMENINGKLITTLNLEVIPNGFYIIEIVQKSGNIWRYKIVKN